MGLPATSGMRLVLARPSATESATSQGVSLERANEVTDKVLLTKAGPIIGMVDQAGCNSEVACMY